MSDTRASPLCFAAWCASTWIAALACGCGSGQPKGEPIVSIGTGDGGVDGGGGSLEALVGADSSMAAEVLTGAIRNGKGSAAAWAAVYVLRLGINHEREPTRAALKRGAFDEDPLLAALCWRWLAADPEAQLPRWPKGERPTEPVVGAMAALAYARRDKLPRPLRDALGLPEGDPSGDRKQPSGLTERLTFLAGPFDTGPLALAVVFAEARREGWIESAASGDKHWAAERLRSELYNAVGGEGELPARLLESDAQPDPRYSDLRERLDTPLASRPPEVLRGAILSAEGSLKVGAIRALAVASSEPAAGDLGVVAAAMRSPDPLVRVEAARTFLLLAALATDLE